MLKKREKAPFIIRTVLVMTVLYLSVMLIATGLVQDRISNEISDRFGNELFDDFRNCITSETDSSAYAGGINQAQALTIMNCHKYRLYRKYHKYEGEADIRLYEIKQDKGKVVSLTEVVPKTPVLTGSPLTASSRIVVFADSFNKKQIQKIEEMAKKGEIGSYIDEVSGYQNGRFCYLTKMVIEYDGKSTVFEGNPIKKGKPIRNVSLQDFEIHLPDGTVCGGYQKDSTASEKFATEAESELKESMIGSSFEAGESGGSYWNKNGIKGGSRYCIIGDGKYILAANIKLNTHLYAAKNLGNFYILSLLAVIALTGILITAHNTQIEEKFESEGRRRMMMDSLAHDMKTPISIIHGFSELILKENSRDKQIDYAENIIAESRRMNDAIVDMLNMSKMEAGTYPMDLSDFSPAELIRENSGRYAAILHEKGMNIKTDLRTENRIFADRKLISTAVSNFIINAARNGKEGSDVLISLADTNNGIRISVHNYGESIPEGEQAKIWEAWYQRSGSSGLGLAIVRNICLLHGGTYGSINENGGVTFWMQLASQENRIGQIDSLTGPVTGITEPGRSVEGIIPTAIGTIIQGLFWTCYFSNSIAALSYVSWTRGNEVIMIPDAFAIAAGLGVIIGTVIEYAGIRRISRYNGSHKKEKAAVFAAFLSAGLFVLACAVGERFGAENAGIISEVLATTVSIALGVSLIVNCRMISHVLKSAGRIRQSRRIKRQSNIMTIVIALLICTSIIIMFETTSMIYEFMLCGWFVISLVAAISWIVSKRR